MDKSTPSIKIFPSVASTNRKKDSASVLFPEPVLPRTPTYNTPSRELETLAGTWIAYLLSGVYLERKSMKYIWQLGLKRFVSGHFRQGTVGLRTHRISNDEVFALNTSSGRPGRRRPGLDELRRLTFEFRVFLDSLNGDLESGK